MDFLSHVYSAFAFALDDDARFALIARAAVTAAAVLGVTEPFSSGIGGGGFMVVYRASDGKVTTIDGRERAPAAMRPDSFWENERPLPFNDARFSGLSVGVPELDDSGKVTTWTVSGAGPNGFRDIGISKVQNLPLAPWKRTGGRGSYHMEYSHYEEVPQQFQAKIIAAAKAARGQEVAEEV